MAVPATEGPCPTVDFGRNCDGHGGGVCLINPVLPRTRIISRRPTGTYPAREILAHGAGGPDDVARAAYLCADAMLKERAK